MAPPIRLREARLAAGLTQRQLAQQLGMVQPVIARWETGGREPRVRAAIRVAQALGTSVEAIWPVDDDGPNVRGRAPR